MSDPFVRLRPEEPGDIRPAKPKPDGPVYRFTKSETIFGSLWDPCRGWLVYRPSAHAPSKQDH